MHLHTHVPYIFGFISFSLILLIFFLAPYSILWPSSIDSDHGFHETLPDKNLILVEPLLTEQPLTTGASVMTVTYGPFTTASRTLRPEEVVQDIVKPCDDCYVVAMHALLTDINGTELFSDSGVWLHHIIFFNSDRPDLVCPQMGERFFGGGNERWTRRWNSNGPWGYKVDEHDKWDVVVELMNDDVVERTVEIAVRFEIVPVNSPEYPKYRGITAVWMDLTGCGHADVSVKSQTDAFEYRTPDWKSTISGPMIDVGGHMHDGGSKMTAYKNGDPICVSEQLYDNQASVQHIVAAGMCKNAGVLHEGDVLWADAKYDPNIHRLVMHGGIPDPVMGSMGVYIGLD